MRLFYFLLFGAFFLPLLALAELRIAYYGGTFDPPTRGHRGLIERAIKAANLDLVYMFPSMSNAKKPNATPYPLRRQMVEAMISEMPNVLGPDAELEEAFQRGRLAAEIEVIMKRHPGAKVFIMMGDDVISRNYTKFITENPAFDKIGVIIGQRNQGSLANPENINAFNFDEREVILFPPEMDEGISSTVIKNKFKNGQSVGKNYLDEKVQSVIRAFGLYPPLCPGLF